MEKAGRAGTLHNSAASNYIQAIEERQGLMVACLEEIAYRMGYISAEDVARLASGMASSCLRSATVWAPAFQA